MLLPPGEEEGGSELLLTLDDDEEEDDDAHELLLWLVVVSRGFNKEPRSLNSTNWNEVSSLPGMRSHRTLSLRWQRQGRGERLISPGGAQVGRPYVWLPNSAAISAACHSVPS